MSALANSAFESVASLDERLLIERNQHIAKLTFNRPEARNAVRFTGERHIFRAATDLLNDDRDLRCVIITGAGDAFSAGGDLDELRVMAADTTLSPQDLRDRYAFGIHEVVHALWGLRMPVIAAVNGAAVGLGNDLACLADIRIAARSAKFGATFLKLGLIPGDGGAWLLSRTLGYARAAEMLFTGEMIDAAAALDWGLVTHLADDDDLMIRAMELAERIAQQPSDALRATKALLRASATQDFETIMAASASHQAIFHKSREHSDALDAAFASRARRHAQR